jgi:hypothetical protein
MAPKMKAWGLPFGYRLFPIRVIKRMNNAMNFFHLHQTIMKDKIDLLQ